MKLSQVSAFLVFATAAPFALASAQSSSAELPKWSLSTGADPTHFDLRTKDPGVDLRLVGNLTRTWQDSGSRFSRHVSLMLGGDWPQTWNYCDGCYSRRSRQYAGLTVGPAVDLFRLWRFTPYLQGGAGIYASRVNASSNGVPFLQNSVYNRSRLSFGINGGFGVRAKLGSHEFFVEQMAHAFDVREMNTGVYPLNFGIRF